MRRPRDEDLFTSGSDFNDIACPHCDSTRTTLQSLFGSTASEALLFCEACRSCFAWVKWRRRLPAGRLLAPRERIAIR